MMVRKFPEDTPIQIKVLFMTVTGNILGKTMLWNVPIGRGYTYIKHILNVCCKWHANSTVINRNWTNQRGWGAFISWDYGTYGSMNTLHFVQLLTDNGLATETGLSIKTWNWFNPVHVHSFKSCRLSSLAFVL